MHSASSTFLLLLSLAALSECQSAFRASTQQFIVDIHNTLRSKIAKGTYVAGTTAKASATNMRKMSWDATLATAAQTYANTCPRDHSNTAGVGENMYYRWTTLPFSGLDVYGGAASVAWEQEFQQFGWPSNTFSQALANLKIGHATQMAWASTNLIGCGVKACGPDAQTQNMNRLVVVCQYKAQGNYLNTNIYASGATCSACPTGTTCETATGLCA